MGGLEVDKGGGSRLLSMAVSTSVSAATVLDAHGDSLELSFMLDTLGKLPWRPRTSQANDRTDPHDANE